MNINNVGYEVTDGGSSEHSVDGNFGGHEVISLSDSPGGQMAQVASYCFGMNVEQERLLRQAVVAFPLESEGDKVWLEQKGEDFQTVVALYDQRQKVDAAVKEGFEQQEVVQQKCGELTDQMFVSQQNLNVEHKAFATRYHELKEQISKKEEALIAQRYGGWLQSLSKTLNIAGNVCLPLSAGFGALAAYNYQQCAVWLVCSSGHNSGVLALGTGAAFAATQVHGWQKRRAEQDLRREVEELKSTLTQDQQIHEQNVSELEQNIKETNEVLQREGQKLTEARENIQAQLDVQKEIDAKRSSITEQLVEQIAHLSLSNLERALKHRNDAEWAETGRSSLKIVMNAALTAVTQSSQLVKTIASGKKKLAIKSQPTEVHIEELLEKEEIE